MKKTEIMTTKSVRYVEPRMDVSIFTSCGSILAASVEKYNEVVFNWDTEEYE